MAINQANAGSDSVERLQNNSFDKQFQMNAVEILGFDGQNLQRINATSMAIRIERDGSENPIYLGIAAPGTATSGGLWQIRKLTFDASSKLTALQFAGGSPDFAYVWDDRSSLSYS